MLFFILTLSCTLNWADSKNCPDKYARLSEDHTYCRDPYPSCDRKHSGVSKDDIDHILKLHNTYRSQVAMGQETRAGGLPKASNMLQMVWDKELATIAQKWADNCLFDHDCIQCREVANFPVGQNLGEAFRDNCYTRECLGSLEPRERYADWASNIKNLYDEVNYYDKSWLSKYWERSVEETGHFTQIIWAKTWRVGCGFTAFLRGATYTRFYVCNYGPGLALRRPFGIVVSEVDCGTVGPGRKSSREVGGEKQRWEAPDHPQSVLPQNWYRTEKESSVTCMVLKATANDRRKNLALICDEFRGH
ncbi:hypothetical protein TNCV_3973921 [Trichonephila clavipes]|nr:hypothetical protein TNCV_3973921 [Trichonephila clavipes]